MEINEKEKLHGVAILRLFKMLHIELPQVNFSLRQGKSDSAYIIEGLLPKTFGKGRKLSLGLFLKISHKRLMPWRYNFHKSDQDEVLQLKMDWGECFTIFATGDDGFACLSFDNLKEILDNNHEDQEWVSISRKTGQSYRVAGNDGIRKNALARAIFPKVIAEDFKHQLKL
jgi:hypothetical protein